MLKRVFRCFRMKLRGFKISLSGRPKNDLSFKQQMLIETGLKFNCAVLVETGTFRGDTTRVGARFFDRVYTIELSKELYEHNLKRFSGKKNIFLHQGDSDKVLKELMNTVLMNTVSGNERMVFWLDAHYSGSGTSKREGKCPVLDELEAIKFHPRRDHCVLIDDADMFGEDDEYPELSEVIRQLKQINPDFSPVVKNNIIVAVPLSQ